MRISNGTSFNVLLPVSTVSRKYAEVALQIVYLPLVMSNKSATVCVHSLKYIFFFS